MKPKIEFKPNMSEVTMRTYDVSSQSYSREIQLHTTFDYVHPNDIKPGIYADDIEIPAQLASGSFSTRFTRIALRRFSDGPLRGMPSTLECSRTDLFCHDVLEYELGEEVRRALGSLASTSYRGLKECFTQHLRISEATVTRLCRQSIDASV